MPAAYNELAPPPDLASYVLCFWTQAPAGEGQSKQHILPDGCVDLIWPGPDGQPFVAGPDATPREYALTPGAGLRGLRLRPGRAGSLLGVDAREILGIDVSLAGLWGSACSDDWAIAGQPGLAGPFEAIAGLARRRLDEIERADDVVIAASDMLACRPMLPVEELAASLA